MDKNKNQKKPNKRVWLEIILLLIVIADGVILFFTIGNKNNKKDEKTLAYTDLIKEISYGNIEKVEMTVGSTTVKVKVKKVICTVE